jgi:flagellar motility protein MotE (MotC chaperone)
MTQDVLKKDIDDLNNLRTEVSSMIARLKEERDKLLKTRLEISQAEKGNLTTVAAAYDKMDATSASKILASMCTGGVTQKQDGQVRLWATGFDDAVKILHYMGERTKAKLLAELVNTEPKLAASLCERLKQINEVR